jgi:hypothetical protein
MMIKRVTGNFDEQKYRFNDKRLRKKNHYIQPVDAVVFEKHDSKDDDPKISEQIILSEIIKMIPDEVVCEKIEKQMKSYESIDDALVDKLIMEEL